jgi:trehalose/maltose hydrolase-like predicted phosphorylase
MGGNHFRIFQSICFEIFGGLNDFVRLYKPKAYINDKIEVKEEEREKFKSSHLFISNMIRHFKNKERVCELFEKYTEKENITYDSLEKK